MATHLEIETDLRVKDLLPYLLEIEKMHFSYEIDSANYGEGYELIYMDVILRLFDDDRSDEAMIDEDFINGKITWTQAFQKVVEKNKGQAVLKIELDRLDRFPEIQQEAKKAIIDKLKIDGFKVREN
jgi:hypothetical protein